MPVLTDLASAEIKRSTTVLYGKILTRPALLVSDGLNAVYAADVAINETDPTGTINQYYEQKKNGQLAQTGGIFHPLTTPTNKSGMLTGLPGQAPEDWNLSDTLTVNTILHNVPVAKNNKDLIYADVNSPVQLKRSASGQWEIVGFSQERPGTFTMIPVDLGDMTIGSVIDLSIDARLLDLGELGTMRPFGTLPLGASAIFIGGQLDRIV